MCTHHEYTLSLNGLIFDGSMMSLHSTTASQELQSIRASLNFYPPGRTKQVVYHLTPSFYTRKYDAHTVSITNIRGRESEFSFFKNGIEWFTAPTCMSYADFSKPDQVDTKYLPEAEKILKERLGASRVIVRLPNIRKDDWPTDEELGRFGENDTQTRFRRIAPAKDIHIDATPKCAKETLLEYVSEDELKSVKRWIYFSYWRPLKPILKDPLCAADITTIKPDDLVVFQRYLPQLGRCIENYGLLYREGQRFYWRKGMGPDDVMLIRFWDNEGKQEVRGSPHSSFEDAAYVREETRESIEVRCFALWE